jgi:DNA-binding Xre family transcriptional regulator
MTTTIERELHERTLRLRELMKKHRLSASDVADMVGRSEATVFVWRSAGDHRVIPANTLELLELKLAGRNR